MHVGSAVVAAALAWLSASFAPNAAAQSVPGGLDCKQLAAMPNAPMTVERCEAMVRSQSDIASAMQTRGGERPGDDRMTCAQISTEMKALPVSGVSASTAARAKAAGEDLKAAQQRAQADTAALAGRQTARTAAAAAAPGNAIGGANAMQGLAEQKVLQERAASELRPAQDRAMQANERATTELAESMRSNPRFARLMQLAVQRHCTE